MDSNTLFWIVFFSGGISTVLILLRFRKIKRIMLIEDTNFTGHINNTVDAFRILKVYIKSETLNKEERNFLGFTLFLIGISFLSLIALIVLFIF